MGPPTRDQERTAGADPAVDRAHALVVDGRGIVRSATRDVHRTLRWPPEALAGRSVIELVHAAERGAVLDAIRAAAGGAGTTVEHRLRAGDGRWYDATTSVSPLDGDDEPLVLLATSLARSVDEEAEGPAAVAARYRQVVATSADALIVHVDGEIVAVSPPALALVGAADDDDVVGRSLLAYVDTGSLAAAERRRDVMRAGGWPGTERLSIRRVDGTTTLVETFTTPALWDGRLANQITVRPVPGAAEELDAVAGTIAGGVLPAAIVTDLSLRVVAVNPAACERYGWSEVDVHGQHLAEATRSSDPAEGRAGADAAVAAGHWDGVVVHRDGTGAPMATHCSLRRLDDRAGRPIGILAVLEPVEVEPGEPSTDDDAVSADLRRAIAAGEIRVFYQPIVSLRDGGVQKVEALVRWQHPDRGLVPPSEFVEVAERTGAIVELGEHVLDAACRQVASWRRSTQPGLELSVNLSPRELSDGAVVDRVRQALLRHGLPPQALWLEVTETAMSSDPQGALAVLRQLRDLGVRLAIDDFGTGFANLANLRQYPFLAVKIDRSFVNGLGVDASDLVIVRSILKLAGELGLLVVAEGVETDAQRQLLCDLGCELGQGYLYSRPTPPDESEAWLLAGGFGTTDGDDDVTAPHDGPAPGTLLDLAAAGDGSDAALETAARAAAALLGTSTAFVAVEEGGATWVVAGVGVPTGRAGPSDLYRRCVADATGTCTVAGEELAALAGDPLAGVAGAGTWAATTLVVGTEVVGALCVADPDHRPLGADDLATLRQLGEQAGAALELRQRTVELYQARRALALADDRVRDLESRHAGFERATEEAFIEVTVDGAIVYVSPSSTALMGFDRDHWLGRNALDLVHPDDVPTALMSLTQTAAHVGRARPIDLRLLVADGSYLPLEVTSTTFESGSGHRVLICARDRSGGTGAAAELAWLRSVLDEAFGLVGEVVAACDEHGTVRALSPAARELHRGIARLPMADWVDRLDLRTADGDPLALGDVPLLRALHGERVEGVFALHRPDGTLQSVAVRAVPVPTGDGAVMALRLLA